MDTDLDQRLARALERREKLSADIQRIQGKKEAAEKQLSDLRSEIQDKKLNPDNLDTLVAELEAAYIAAVENLEAGLQEAKSQLQPYLENTK